MALNFPSSPTIGDIYTDTTSGFSYEWDGTVWKSYTPASSSNIRILDDISGSFNGSTQTFALTVSSVALTPASAQSLIVNLGGVIQEPVADYTVSSSNITFTTPPSSGLSFSGISLGPAISINTIPDGTTTDGTLNVSGNLNVTGIVTAFSSVGIGTTNPTSTLQVTGGDSRFGGVIETVSTATTYMSGSAMVLEMDVRQATTYAYTMPTGANIGIVSFQNMPSQTGQASGTTITLITTQNSVGTGNTTAATGIGTYCTVVGYENGAAVAGISTRGLVGSATTVTLSTTGSDRDFVSFFIHYTGGTNTTASSYQVYVTKNGGFRQGTVGV